MSLAPLKAALPPILCLALLLAPGSMERADAEKTASLAPANNAFALDLYGALKDDAGNLFFSPYSVSSALLMAREGARGETAAQMDTVLHTTDVPRGAAYRADQGALKPPTFKEGWGKDAKERLAYEMNVANALWGQRDFAFEGAFTKSLDEVYGAPLERIDFGETEAARQRINAWVEQQTREKIKNIVPKGVLSPATRLVLANAIYFKAPWQEKFQKRHTQEDTFTGPAGKQSRAPFMRRKGRYLHAQLEGAQVLALPYRSNAASMLVFLPTAKDGLTALEAALVAGKLTGAHEALEGRLVDVQLPKFKFTTATDLTGVLPRMGMKDAFDPTKADFSGMTKAEKLFIGAVLHKAFVAVDEEGTEAAAATVIMMKGTAAPRPETPVLFKADHPFLFVIRHRRTGAILFMGRVNEPTQ